jgi:abortive infection bacteriophage resistance protein
MKYQKHPLTIDQQIAKLEERGLFFENKSLAKNYLGNISYYRLRAYTYPFQNNDDPELDHQFIRDDISFQDVIDLYLFDRRLRTLIFNELEKVEVAMRTKLSQIYSEYTNDSHWYEDPNWYDPATLIPYGINSYSDFDNVSQDIYNDVSRSGEDFIKHFYNKYDSPDMPPSWMTMEVISFGTLSWLYKLLKNNDFKKDVAKAFGIPNVDIFANWLHAFSGLRNCCAHHSRIWNRRFAVKITLPYNTIYPFISRDEAQKIKQNKLFAVLSALKYVVDIISPNNSFKQKLFSLLNENHRLLSMREMGFPVGWENYPVWRC